MAVWVIEQLDRQHQRDHFRCGHSSLDDFLQRLSNQYERRDLGRTYVAVPHGDKRVAGYYTLAASALFAEALPSDDAKKLPRHLIPVALLARLAVDLSSQGAGLGRLLLFDALRRSLDHSKGLGIHGVIVHAIDESAIRFYQKYGFTRMLDAPSHLFLPTASLKRLAFESEQSDS